MTSVRVLVLFASIGALSCGGSSPTDETPTCRTYPLSFEENGTPFTCRLETGARVTLSCAAGTLNRDWEYANLADFIGEAAVPNRLRVESRRTTAGALLGSFTTTIRFYEYDGQQRLTRRVRTSSNSLGTFELDDARYSQWDAEGRPTRGEIRAGELSAGVSLSYDDGQRRLEASTGERVVVDRNGNILNEVEVFGLGPDPFRFERDYVITATERACLP
ncbi:MAG TPA: hypothetical protein VLK65_33030 [Vicinamibacteria bacterium]|nr:hypothetical protein [Vicinamibacteria bacterium]